MKWKSKGEAVSCNDKYAHVYYYYDDCHHHKNQGGVRGHKNLGEYIAYLPKNWVFN